METFENIIENRKTTEIKGISLPFLIENVMPGDIITLDAEQIREQFEQIRKQYNLT